MQYIHISLGKKVNFFTCATKWFYECWWFCVTIPDFQFWWAYCL